MPPSTARASGAYDSLPAPSFSAIGSSPMMVASDVISTGRSRTRAAVTTAWRTVMPSSAQMPRELHDQNAVGNRHADQNHQTHQRHHVHAGAGQIENQQSAGESRRHRRQNQDADPGTIGTAPPESGTAAPPKASGRCRSCESSAAWPAPGRASVTVTPVGNLGVRGQLVDGCWRCVPGLRPSAARRYRSRGAAGSDPLRWAT